MVAAVPAAGERSEIQSTFVRTAGGGIAMKFPRRHFLHLAGGVAALPTLSRIARAQTYPSRPVRFVVGYPAGNGPDIVGRLLGQRLSERLNQQFVIENKTGAGSNLATEMVMKAPPDGYTLLMVALTNAVNATLYPNLDFAGGIVPVANIGIAEFVMVVNPSVPAKTVPEFIAYAKANPGKINLASQGVGTALHIFGELFKMMAGVDMTHVPYRSSVIVDLLGGQVQIAFIPLSLSLEHVRSGKLRALAVTGAARSAVFPELPTIAESVPGYEAIGWLGVGAPKNTPTETIDALNREINACSDDPRLRSRFADIGIVLTPMTPAQFRTFIAGEIEKWAKVIKFAGIKPA
jgi:tripartite-type tricarboxylate transporter receptor subunit TctC